MKITYRHDMLQIGSSRKQKSQWNPRPKIMPLTYQSKVTVLCKTAYTSFLCLGGTQHSCMIHHVSSWMMHETFIELPMLNLLRLRARCGFMDLMVLKVVSFSDHLPIGLGATPRLIKDMMRKCLSDKSVVGMENISKLQALDR